MTTADSADETARAVRAAAAALSDLDARLPELEARYRHLHAHPELSGQEANTAAGVAAQLQAAGYAVTSGVGGHGVVGVLRNGEGPTVALRGDMDALPITEETERPDRSTTPGVMHACGHDVHTTCLVGTAEALADSRDLWAGTAVIIGQPAEESVSGAAAMLADGLFTRFPRPDAVLGQHTSNAPAGTVWHRDGTLYAAAANLRVLIAGVGGHGARPEATVDPIAISAYCVTRIQAIVAREMPPRTPAVVTVGSFHAGTRPNIIPPHATLELTLRAPDAATVDQLEEAVTRIVRAECAAGRAPTEPEIVRTEHTAEVRNEPALGARVRRAHQGLFGDQVEEMAHMVTGSEDFACYALPGPDRYPAPAIPTAFWFLGTTEQRVWDATSGPDTLSRQLQVPGPHHPRYAPDPLPSLRRGVEALTTGAFAVLTDREGRDAAA